MKQPDPIDDAIAIVEKTVRTEIVHMAEAGVDPDEIRLSVWQAIEPTLDRLGNDARSRLELGIHSVLEDTLRGQP